jgi:DNA-binding protein HU-beta
MQEVIDMATKGLGKGDIAARVSTQLNGSRTEGEKALNAVLTSITEALKKGQTVTLTGFGTFDVRQIKARKVRAIRGRQAGQLMNIPAHKRPGFRAGSELQRAVGGRR